MHGPLIDKEYNKNKKLYFYFPYLGDFLATSLKDILKFKMSLCMVIAYS